MIDEHATAILAILTADISPAPLVVYDGAVPPGAAPPYVLVYCVDADPEHADSRSLAGRSERYVLRAICHSVGGNQAAARMVADRVRADLLDVIPTVAGRRCFPIRREVGQPMRRDETTGALLMDKVDTYRIESVPA